VTSQLQRLVLDFRTGELVAFLNEWADVQEPRRHADDLADEAEIAAAVEVAREDRPQWRAP
jgi:hypothetical protein